MDMKAALFLGLGGLLLEVHRKILEQKIEIKDSEIQELKAKVKELTPKPPQRKQDRNYHGPSL